MLKKFLVGTVVALALLVGVTASAADFGTTTLKVGSKGPAVVAVQTLVGATADGVFGPMTKAKVMAWQASNGLVADGLFGTNSKAKAVNGSSVVGGTTFSAGCTSASGFSATTGQACVSLSANTFAPAGCTNASGFSPVTGGACYATSSTVAGCAAGALFSATTGASCTTGVVTTTTGPLVGGAGDATLTHYATSEKSQIKEGDSGVKVLGFRVEAQDSDIALQNVKVNIQNTDAISGSSSYRIDRYLDSVDIYQGSTKVGSANVADFTKDSSNIYSKSIALSNAVVRNGDKSPFYVVFNAVSSMDTANDGAKLVVSVDTYRFQDATGVIMTNSADNTITNDVTIDTSADALSLLSSSNNPDNVTVKVDESSTTDQVQALAFKLKAGSNSSDITLDTLPIIVNIKGAGATATSSTDVIDSVVVKIGNKTITADEPATTTINDGGSVDVIYTADFSNEGIVIAAGETIEAQVYITFVEQGGTPGNYKDGTTQVTASMDGTKVTAESNNTDTIKANSLQTGAVLTLSTTAATVTTSSPTSAANNDGSVGTFSFTFKVAADNGAVTLENDATTGFAYEILGTETALPGDSGSIATAVVSKISGTATLNGSTYTVADGDNATFSLDVTITPTTPNIGNGVYRVHLTTVAGNSVDLTAGPQTIAFK